MTKITDQEFEMFARIAYLNSLALELYHKADWLAIEFREYLLKQHGVTFEDFLRQNIERARKLRGEEK